MKALASYTPSVSERRSGTTTYSHSALKNNAAQTGTGQTVGATRTYDAFGNVVASTGTFKGPFGYAGPFGYQEDGDSGLKLLGHRYYDSSTGRFLTRDPAKDGRNWYVYCENNPVARYDITGLFKVGVSGGGIFGFLFLGFWGGGALVIDQHGNVGVQVHGGFGTGFGAGGAAGAGAVVADGNVRDSSGLDLSTQGFAGGGLGGSANVNIGDGGRSAGGGRGGPAIGGGGYIGPDFWVERRLFNLVQVAEYFQGVVDGFVDWITGGGRGGGGKLPLPHPDFPGADYNMGTGGPRRII